MVTADYVLLLTDESNATASTKNQSQFQLKISTHVIWSSRKYLSTIEKWLVPFVDFSACFLFALLLCCLLC
jgi:hypothetical protein